MIKPSVYNIITIDNNSTLIFNLRTSAFVAIDSDSLTTDLLNELETGATDCPNLLNVKTTNPSLVDNLTTGGFVIDSIHNEFAEVKSRYEKYRNSDDQLALTLLSSEGCNFRCPYCFIYSRRGMNMTDEVYSSVLKLVEHRAKQNLKLKIAFFGGEPTLNHGKNIDLMESINRMANVFGFSKVSYSIVTNGYLLTKSMFEDYIKRGMEHIQVTLDGTRESHDKTRFHASGSGTFDTIWNNLLSLRSVDGNFNFAIRANFLKSNQDSMKALASDFQREFGHDLRFTLYFKPVYDFSSDRNEIDSIQNDIFTLDEGQDVQMSLNLYSAGISGKLRSEFLYSNPLPYPIPGWCDTVLQNFFVIGADGLIFKCDSAIGDELYSIGQLSTNGEITLSENSLPWTESIYDSSDTDKCRSCKLLPICQGGCQRRRVEGQKDCHQTEDLVKKAMINIHRFHQNNKAK